VNKGNTSMEATKTSNRTVYILQSSHHINQVKLTNF